MELTDIYKQLFETVRMRVDDEGFVSRVTTEETLPATIDGRRIIIPIKSQLKNPDWDTRFAFHPFWESVGRDESVVLTEYRKALVARLNTSVSLLIRNLLLIGSSVELQKKLNPDQEKLFLSLVKDVDKTTIDNWDQIVDNMDGNTTRKLVHIYLKRSGIIKDTRYNHIAVVSFPLYEELLKFSSKENRLFGHQVRVKDAKVYRGLFEFMFKQITTPEEYNYGSNSKVAPLCESLLNGSLEIIREINFVVDVLGDNIPESEFLYIQTDWAPVLDIMPTLLPQIRKLPALPGNEGRLELEQKNEDNGNRDRERDRDRDDDRRGRDQDRDHDDRRRERDRDDRRSRRDDRDDDRDTGVRYTNKGIDFHSIRGGGRRDRDRDRYDDRRDRDRGRYDRDDRRGGRNSRGGSRRGNGRYGF